MECHQPLILSFFCCHHLHFELSSSFWNVINLVFPASLFVIIIIFVLGCHPPLGMSSASYNHIPRFFCCHHQLHFELSSFSWNVISLVFPASFVVITNFILSCHPPLGMLSTLYSQLLLLSSSSFWVVILLLECYQPHIPSFFCCYHLHFELLSSSWNVISLVFQLLFLSSSCWNVIYLVFPAAVVASRESILHSKMERHHCVDECKFCGL